MANRAADSSSVSSPTVRVLPEIRLRASTLGWKDSSSAACSTRSRVPGATSSRWLSALEAVATETPARLATSVSVTCARFLGTGLLPKSFRKHSRHGPKIIVDTAERGLTLFPKRFSKISGGASMTGPVVPSRGALRPVGPAQVRLTGGFWGRRQAVNGSATLDYSHTWIDRMGWSGNFADPGTDRRRGREFSDSEVYKLTEALC